MNAAAPLPECVAHVAGRIAPADSHARATARCRIDNLTKPVGSLGQLEIVAEQMAGIFAGRIPSPLRKAVFVFAADHGVVAEGVSPYPQEVTAQMVHNFLSGGAAINVLARANRAELTVVDVGVNAEFATAPGLHCAKVRHGSRNLAHEPAMLRKELAAALEVGIELATKVSEHGVSLVAVGEMGIGNTTAASAMTAMLTGQDAAVVTGRGTGLNPAAHAHKISVIRGAITRHFDNGGCSASPLEVLRCVGGLEIAAMTGFYLGAAAQQMAVICDGFISTAAAAVAIAVAPDVKEYLFAGHLSDEPGHRFLLESTGLEPLLRVGMRLGEGTGAVLAMPLIESAVRLYAEMATFASAGVSTAGV